MSNNSSFELKQICESINCYEYVENISRFKRKEGKNSEYLDCLKKIINQLEEKNLTYKIDYNLDIVVS